MTDIMQRSSTASSEITIGRSDTHRTQDHFNPTNVPNPRTSNSAKDIEVGSHNHNNNNVHGVSARTSNANGAGQKGPSSAAGHNSAAPRPLRAMLARGAACDLCRSRKVKCDGARPVCSQCKKSSRGKVEDINCVYEGGASARAASSSNSSSAGQDKKSGPNSNANGGGSSGKKARATATNPSIPLPSHHLGVSAMNELNQDTFPVSFENTQLPPLPSLPSHNKRSENEQQRHSLPKSYSTEQSPSSQNYGSSTSPSDSRDGGGGALLSTSTSASTSSSSNLLDDNGNHNYRLMNGSNGPNSSNTNYNNVNNNKQNPHLFNHNGSSPSSMAELLLTAAMAEANTTTEYSYSTTKSGFSDKAKPQYQNESIKKRPRGDGSRVEEVHNVNKPGKRRNPIATGGRKVQPTAFRQQGFGVEVSTAEGGDRFGEEEEDDEGSDYDDFENSANTSRIGYNQQGKNGEEGEEDDNDDDEDHENEFNRENDFRKRQRTRQRNAHMQNDGPERRKASENGADQRLPKTPAGRRKGQSHRVDVLVDRITELERRLRLQSQPVPAAVHTHVRASPSPPFYPSSYGGLPVPSHSYDHHLHSPLHSHGQALQGSESFAIGAHAMSMGISLSPMTSMAGLSSLSNGGSGLTPTMEMRRTLSWTAGEEPSAKDIAAAWTPESSVRFSGREIPNPPVPASSSAEFGAGMLGTNRAVNTGLVATQSASQTSPNNLLQTGSPGSVDMRGPNGLYANGSSYPPLYYTPGLALNTGSTIPDGNALRSMPFIPTQSDSKQPTHAGNSANKQTIDRFGPATSPATDAVQTPGRILDGFFNSIDGSLATSPEDDISLDASLMQILYPAWPKTLPLPSVVHRLVATFFNRATVPSSIINRARFFSNLEQSPDSPSFPHPALIHAICAYASPLVSTESLSEGPAESYLGKMIYWDSEKSPREYHYVHARKLVEEGLYKKNGNNFQLLQAMVLCAYTAYQSAAFTDLWILSSQATRLCVPLGLNHMRPWDYENNNAGPDVPTFGSVVRRTPASCTILPKAECLEEYYERSATFWATFAIDRHASASTEWCTSLDELDISTQLPSMVATPLAAIDMKDLNFYSENTHLSSFALYVKAVILLGRVTNYWQRITRWRTLGPGETCSALKAECKATPEFKALDMVLSKFRTQTSGNFFDSGEGIDGYSASAYAIPHVASILLHEPLVDRYDRSANSSFNRCLTSAKCVIQSTYVLAQSSNDLSGIDPFLPYCWSVVGRALVRDYAMRRQWGETDLANASKELAQHCLTFTSKCESVCVIAALLNKTLTEHLENPNVLLPPDGTSATNNVS